MIDLKKLFMFSVIFAHVILLNEISNMILNREFVFISLKIHESRLYISITVFNVGYNENIVVKGFDTDSRKRGKRKKWENEFADEGAKS